VFAICVITGIIIKMRNTLFFHVWAPNIYGTTTIYLIIFLKVISKVLFFN